MTSVIPTHLSVSGMLRRAGVAWINLSECLPHYHPKVEGKLLQLYGDQLVLTGLGSALLSHNQMEEAHKPDGDPLAWAKILLGSGFSYGLSKLTVGGYPAMMLGFANLRAGHHEDVLSKLQEFVKALVFIPLTVLGYKVGESFFTQAQEFTDNQSLLKSLQALASTHATKPFMTEPLTQLRQALENLPAHANELATNQLNQAKITALSYLDSLPIAEKTAWSQQAPKAFGALHHVLRRGQEGYVQLARALNPVMGVVVATCAGVFVAKWVNEQLAMRLPQLAHKHFELFGSDLYGAHLPGGEGEHGEGFGLVPNGSLHVNPSGHHAEYRFGHEGQYHWSL